MRIQGILALTFALALLGLPQALRAGCPQAFAGTAWGQFEPETYNNGGVTGVTGGEGYWRGRLAGDNTNDNSGSPGAPSCAFAGCMTYSFTLAAGDAGYYKIEALVYAPNGSSNSFFVGLNGRNDTCSGANGAAGNNSSGNPWLRRWDIATDNNFRWRYVTDWNQNNTAGNARVWYLPAGTYSLEFRGREISNNATLLAKVRFMRLPDLAPTPTPTNSPTRIPTPACPVLSTPMGNTVTGGVAIDTSSYVYFMRWAAPATGGAPGMQMYSWGFGGTNPRMRVALYADLAGVPGTLMTESQTVHIPDSVSWVYLPFTVTAQVVTATNYWMAFQVSNANARGIYNTGVGILTRRLAGAFGAFPVSGAAALDPTSGTNNQRWAAYVPVCAAPPTPTPTSTPTPTPIVGGLPPYKRLYGLEYVPFPEVTSGSFIFYPLHLTVVASSGVSRAARNTARWRVELQNLSGTGLAEVQLETRIGLEGISCTTGYFNPDNYLTATALTLPPRPQNLSTTYMWVNAQVPVTERFDAMGDPRFVPYKDMLGRPTGETFENGYNWFFANLTVTGGVGYAEYSDFLPRAGWGKTNPDIATRAGTADTLFGANMDVPKLFKLWRDGITEERAVFNNIAGVTAFYVGPGGQIGGEGFNNLATGLSLYGGPWNSTTASGTTATATTGYKVCEIIRNGWKATNTNGTYVVVSGTGAADWKSMPWLGELWPDMSYYDSWSSEGASSTHWGNLQNKPEGGSYYRASLNGVSFTATGNSYSSTSSRIFSFERTSHCPGDYGSRSLMNNTGASGVQFGHLDAGGTQAAMQDALLMGQDFNMAIDDPGACSRPWKIDATTNQTNGANPVGQSYERNLAPYSTAPMTLQLYSGERGATDAMKGLYEYSGTGSSTQSRTSGAIRGVIGTEAGFWVISGLAAGTTSGFSVLSRFNLVAALRTFLDAGAPITSTATAQGSYNNYANTSDGTSSGIVLRIAPPPRVEFISPRLGENLKGRSIIGLAWKERYARWDGARYTENYPCLDDNAGVMTNAMGGADCAGAADPLRPGNPAREWHDTEPLVFNLKYSANSGGDWYSIPTGETATAGVRMEGANEIAMDPSSLYSHNWDISGMTQGIYLIRVECYRRNIGSHFAFHEIPAELEP